MPDGECRRFIPSIYIVVYMRAVYLMYIQLKQAVYTEANMNLRVAQKELGSRGPEVAGFALAVEAVVVVGVSIVLVGLFS